MFEVEQFKAYSDLLDQDDKRNLAALIRKLNVRGHNPATSGNYSLRAKRDADVIFISQSGVDKSLFSSENFMKDFAVSMTAYYIGTRFGLQTSIEIRNPSDGQLYKTYSEFDVIKNSNLHQSKICPMSEFLFRESCSTTLGGI